MTDAHVVSSSTLNILIATRILATDPDEAAALVAAFRYYPADRLADPPANRLVRPDGKEWSGTQPRGLAYWEVLARLVAEEPVQNP